MTNYIYEYAVLRYIHDPVTMETLNIGVIVYSSAAKFLQFSVNHKHNRLSKAFQGFDGIAYQQVVSNLETKVNQMAKNIFAKNQAKAIPERLSEILPQILIDDDTSFAFAKSGGGIVDNPSTALADLYERMVMRYAGTVDDGDQNNGAPIWVAVDENRTKK